MKDLLSEMAAGIEGLRLLTVLDSDCMVLASWEAPENTASPDALGVFVQQIKNTISTFKRSANGFSKVDDIVLGTPASYMMLKPICNGSCFIVADAGRAVSLGSIRAAFQSFTPRLEQTIPGYEEIVS
jgi:hypothetical protein